ncbi:farnesol dehydrogenase-like isoform X1 [Culicoides brevitarsis]|uniref:farnesol dehydrogenase-like isoform X1 n=1 Tax=Culicoides brevitarsis TaxID=469753 RepID=UPI00307B8E54
MEKWAGKVAVVTGASGGIGAGICKELVRAGMIVCGFSRRVDQVEALRAELTDASGQLNAVECDLRSEQSVMYAYNWIINTYGGVDLLINNAGVLTKQLLLDSNNTKELSKIFETSLIGICLCTKFALKSMTSRNVEGYVVNINSIFGHTLNVSVPGLKPLNGSFAVAKFGVFALSEYLKQELRYLNLNIKLSSISPGLTETDFLAQPSEFSGNKIVEYMPKLKPKDVADALMYIITRPKHLQIDDITIKPMGEFI